MKRYIYLLFLAVSLAGISSCSKSNDPEPDPVVGTWKLDRVRTSGFSAPYTSFNGDEDPSLYDYQDNFTIKSDKTFTGTVRNSGRIIDYDGSWSYSSNTLMISDTQGNSSTFTLDATKSPVQLLGEVVALSDSIRNPTTNKGELVRFSQQLIYSKQP